MHKHPALWFLVGWLFSLLFPVSAVTGMFSGTRSRVATA